MQGTQTIERIKRTRNVEPTDHDIVKQTRKAWKRMQQAVRASERQRKHADAL